MDKFRMSDPFPPTPKGFHCRVTDTLNGLKEDPMKKRHKIGTSILVAAAVLTLLIGTALAAGYFSGEIDWTGRQVSENLPQGPYATPTPAPSGAAEAMARSEYEQTIWDGQPETEFWSIRWPEGDGTGQPSQKTFSSLTALNSFLRESGTPFLLMEEAPDGYTFEAAYCRFYFTADVLDSATVETEELDMGATLTKIRFDAGLDALVSDYSVDFRATDGSYLSVYANLSSVEINDYTFGVNEDETYEALEVPGMEHALLIGSADHRNIAMIARIPEIEGYSYPDQYWDGMGVDTFSYIDYSILANNATRAELIRVAESLK